MVWDAANVVVEWADKAIDWAEDAVDAVIDNAEDTIDAVVDDTEDDVDAVVDNAEDDVDAVVDNAEDTEEMVIDLEKSEVMWKWKSWPKAHNGTIGIKAANLSMSNGEISGGTFVMDMTTIKATDIDSDWLENHLRSDDFFDVENHPTSTMMITNVDGNTITADLTIRGETLPISFDIEKNDWSVSTSFSIDGTQWWVNDSGVKDALVSDTIDLDVVLAY